MLGISRDGLQGVGGGLKENAVNCLLVLIGDGGDLFRDCEHHMKVRALEEFGLSVLDPLCPGQTLALRAVAIPATVEGVAFITALIASLEVAAQRRGAAHLDCAHDAPLCRGHRRAMLLTISCAVAAEYIRDFQLRAIHEPAAQKYWGGVGLGATGTGRGSRSSGLDVEHTLLVAIRR
jgi:hypothetical protein